jgi:hypothetical protein
VFVTELIGMGVNGVTGDYSRGAAGFLIEDGEITTPVAEFTIAGNLKDMFLADPANDLEFRYGTNAPTLRIDGMTVAVAEPLARRVAAIAREAGALALGRWRTDFKRWEKSPGNPVCEVDLDGRCAAPQRLGAAARCRLAVRGDGRQCRSAGAVAALGGRSDRRHARLSCAAARAGRCRSRWSRTASR